MSPRVSNDTEEISADFKTHILTFIHTRANKSLSEVRPQVMEDNKSLGSELGLDSSSYLRNNYIKFLTKPVMGLNFLAKLCKYATKFHSSPLSLTISHKLCRIIAGWRGMKFSCNFHIS